MNKRLLIILISIYFINARAYSFESVVVVGEQNSLVVGTTTVGGGTMPKHCGSILQVSCASFESTSYPHDISYHGSGFALHSHENDERNDYINLNNFNITDANQTLMQSYTSELNQEQTAGSMIRQNLVIPVKPNENTLLNVSPDKVEVNWSY